MPRIFICYAHENAGHKAAVLELAGLLRNQDIVVTLDQLVDGERRDWDQWARRRILDADFVLVLASETMRRLGDGDLQGGFRGLRAEVDLLRELYHGEPDTWRKRILPVVLPGQSLDDIPLFLQPHNADHYVVTGFTTTGVADLLRPLTGQPAALVRGQPATVARHWAVSARGTDMSADDFWFTGRHHALAQIGSFAGAGLPGMLVVTGMPGAGKSALLGVCVLRSLAPGLLPADLRASLPDCTIKVAVHARGKDAGTVLTEIASGLGALAGNAADVQELLDKLIDPKAPPVCVIDAVDESEDPSGVADVIRWLSGRAITIAGVRPDAPAKPEGAVQLPAALQVRHPVVVDLDADEHTAARDVAIYVARRLRGDTARPGGYGTTAWDMGVLVDVIGAEVHDEVAAGNFLVAQFVVEEMLAIPVLTDRRRGWSDALHWPKQLGQWIQRDVHRRLGDARGTEARAVLAPVAHALRGGLPVDLWRVLLPSFGTTTSLDIAISAVTASLAFYLTSPAPNHYAMRHEQFAGYFVGSLPPGRGDQIFVEALIDRVPRRDDKRLDWARAEQYAALNLLAHAYGAESLGVLIGDHPACLARVDRLTAGTLLSTAAEPQCQAAADVLRRTAYETSTDYGRRASVLQAHAALAGHADLASALLSQAEPEMTWSVRWSAGAPDRAPIAIGGAERYQAVVPIAGNSGDSPGLVLVRADGTCSMHEAASGQAVSPGIVIEVSDDKPLPVLRAWRTPSGVVHLASGIHDGRVIVRALTGRMAGSVIWECSIEPELRDLARLPGPNGTDIVVALAGDTLAVHPVHPFKPPTRDPLFRANCTASRILPLDSADATAFLTTGPDADLTAWRINHGSGSVESFVHPGLRGERILAGGNANRACVLSNVGQTIEATWLTAGLSSAGVHEVLDDGGRTIRIALAVHEATATAAVADGSGGIRVFDVRPDSPATFISRHDTDLVVYDLAFADPRATTLVVGGWSGSVTFLDVQGQGSPGALRLQQGESAVTVLPLGEIDQSMLVATRGITGLTRIWSVAASRDEPDPPVTSLSVMTVAEDRVLVVAASAGQERLRCWSIEHAGSEVQPLPDLTHPGGVQAMAAARIDDRVWLATAGETSTVLWAVGPDCVVHVDATYPADQPDVEHVVLGADHRIILGTAGPEHLRLWTRDGNELLDAEGEWVTALAYEQARDRLLVAVGNDDGDVRLIEVKASTPMIQTVLEGNPVVAVALLAAESPVVVAADRYNGLVAAPTATIEPVVWQISHLVTAPGTREQRIFGIADTPPRVLSWVTDRVGHLRLDKGVLHELRGKPLHVARTETTVAVADSGGQLLLLDAAGAWVTAANLNIAVDALAGVPGTRMFVAARGGRLICLARLHEER